MVSHTKRERIGRFSQFMDAQPSLLADVLIRLHIRDTLGLPNESIVFDTNAHGKPFLRDHSAFQYNLSHSGGYVACVIGGTPVGIDIETVRPMNLEIIDRFFTKDERQYIQNRPVEKKIIAFFEIWTKKEAYVKYRGTGLSLPFSSFQVLEPQDAIVFHCVFQEEAFVCHVCSGTQSVLNTTIYLTIDTLIEMYERHIPRL